MTVLIRTVFASIALALLTAPLLAQIAAPERYDTLLSELRGAPSQAEADLLSKEIWELWLTAPDEAAQEVLDAAIRRRQAHDFLGAIKELDRLVEFYPDYAEGWNQRATIHFMRGDFEASLADVEEVLAREPRHFGALSGKGMILFLQGNVPLAQLAIREASKYHPFLRERAILGASPGQDL